MININTKYAVKLSITANSFFDPESGCNLFRNTPVYFFNHRPTRLLKEAVEYGRLVDLVGNILGEEEAVNNKPVVETKVTKTTTKGGKAKEDKESDNTGK